MTNSVQSAAIDRQPKRKIYRFNCEPCQKETLFQGFKCLCCGWFRPLKRAHSRIWNSKESQSRAAERRRLILSAKSEYLARKAAESRAKFEGKA